MWPWWPSIGGGRYVLIETGKAEVAFVVVDRYQEQGVGTALMRHLAAIVRHAGLKELTAEVLADNISMLKVFEKSGLRLRTTRDASVIHVALRFSFRSRCRKLCADPEYLRSRKIVCRLTEIWRKQWARLMEKSRS